MGEILYQSERILVREARPEDIETLQATMRLEHAMEVWASSHHTPRVALEESLGISCQAYTGLLDGVPVAMFGLVRTHLDNYGCIWLLCSPAVDEIKLSFFKISKLVVKNFHKTCPILFNYVDARYERSIEWLDRLGALFAEPKPFGPDRLPFLYFEIGVRANV